MKQMYTSNNAASGDDTTVDLGKDDYEIKKETENLTEALKDLENLKSKNLINEEEYNKLRQNLINKFLNTQ